MSDEQSQVTVPTSGFPGADALCERCGYRLRGLPPHGDCPECGQPIARSDPVHRPGLPWQHRISPRAWLATCLLVMLHPKRAYRMLRVDQAGVDGDGRPLMATYDPDDGGRLSNRHDRLFLAAFAVGIGAYWGAIWMVMQLPRPALWAGAVAAAILVLCYIEAAGVTWFSRRRGWRVPLRLGERVVCYAAVGWLPAGLILCKLFVLHVGPQLWQVRFTGGLMQGDIADLPWLVLIGGVSILWFEILVWLGVRQVRYANAPPAQPAQTLPET